MAEVARRGFEAFNRGDFDAAAREMHPEVEWHVIFSLDIGRPVIRGIEAVRAMWEGFTTAWDEIRVVPEVFVHEDEEWVVFSARFFGRGAESGIDIDRPVHYALRVTDDKLRLIQGFDTIAEALERAGAGPGPGA